MVKNPFWCLGLGMINYEEPEKRTSRKMTVRLPTDLCIHKLYVPVSDCTMQSQNRLTSIKLDSAVTE